MVTSTISYWQDLINRIAKIERFELISRTTSCGGNLDGFACPQLKIRLFPGSSAFVFTDIFGWVQSPVLIF